MVGGNDFPPFDSREILPILLIREREVNNENTRMIIIFNIPSIIDFGKSLVEPDRDYSLARILILINPLIATNLFCI